MYYMLLPSLEYRTKFIDALRNRGVQTVFHYIPLHSSPAGMNCGRTHSSMEVTNRISEQLVRMPLWLGLEPQMDELIHNADEAIKEAFA